MLEQIQTPGIRKTVTALPMVSFIINTYGSAALQPELLNEAVWWASQQNYPNVEILVMNDCPQHTLTIDNERWPMVRIINWPQRIPDLGSKNNIANALASGEILLCNDDDDISLPHRAWQAVDELQEYDYWLPLFWLYSDLRRKISRIDGNGCGHSSAAMRREAFLGRFPVSYADSDQHIKQYALNNLRVNPVTLEKRREDVSYVYRWGVSCQHISGKPSTQENYINRRIGSPGTYEITPTVTTDWVAEVEQAALAFAS